MKEFSAPTMDYLDALCDIIAEGNFNAFLRSGHGGASGQGASPGPASPGQQAPAAAALLQQLEARDPSLRARVTSLLLQAFTVTGRQKVGQEPGPGPGPPEDRDWLFPKLEREASRRRWRVGPVPHAQQPQGS